MADASIVLSWQIKAVFGPQVWPYLSPEKPTFMRILICCLIPLLGMGQVIESFDGPFLTADYPWAGDTSHFRVEGGKLRLRAPEAGESFLHLPYSNLDSMEWQVSFTLEFSPSASNQLRIYLALDTPELSGASGYYLEIGENGSDDALQFYALEKGEPQLLALTGSGKFSDDPDVRVRIGLQSNGTWEICVQYNGQGPWLDCIPVVEAHSFPEKLWFGIQCRYTASRREAFTFEDLHILPYTPDMKGPMLLGVDVADSNELRVTFDELLAPWEENDKPAVVLEPPDANAHEVRLEGDGNVLFVGLDAAMEDQTWYCLTVSGIRDVYGNEGLSATSCFTYLKIGNAKAYGLLISEIMADPDPPVGLPVTEYIEVSNRGALTVRLSDYKLRVGEKLYALPPYELLPGTAVAICQKGEETGFPEESLIVTMEDMPQLPNGGAVYLLTDMAGRLLHRVHYDPNVFFGTEKGDGGWSIELQDLSLPCLLGENWAPSIHPRGGTPGLANAPGLIPSPQEIAISEMYPLDDRQLVLRFNQALLPDTAGLDFTCNPAVAIEKITIQHHEVKIRFRDPLTEGTVYSIRFENLRNCLGAAADDPVDASFSLPSPPGSGDVLIHEILFDPSTGGKRFVELANATAGKFLLSTDLLVGVVDGPGQVLYGVSDTVLIPPGGLLVLTPEPGLLPYFYPVPHPEAVLKSELPSWDARGGEVSILNSSGDLLDVVEFTEAMHHPLLDDTKGISLERVSVLVPSDQESNWQSCALAVGGATPAAPNSQQWHGSASQGITMENVVFSPDGDGYRDAVWLHFGHDMDNFVVNALIFDLSGREILRVAENLIVTGELLIAWDGTNIDRLPAPAGKYIFLVECFHPDGRIVRRKMVCTLATGY